MAILAWLRKVQNALHEYAESIRYTEKRKRNLNMPSDKPIEVRAVISFDEKTVADSAAQNKESNATQKSTKNATWAAFYAVAAYAVVTALMWCAMIEQNKISREVFQQSTEAFRVDERAWVEIDQIKPALLSPPDAKSGVAGFSCDLYPKNVGKTVAKDVSIRATNTLAAEDFERDATGLSMFQNKLLMQPVEHATINGKPIFQNAVPKVLAPNSESTAPFRLTCNSPQIFPGGHQFMNFMVGRIDYCDQFDVRHWHKFCYYVVNTRGEVWNCQEGNDEDHNGETKTPATACTKPN